MFDIGWVEIGVIAVVALIVIGPKDLPQALRTLTGWVRKLRGMMREFQSGVDDLVREAELKELRDDIEQSARDGLGDLDPSIDPTGGFGDPFEAADGGPGAAPKVEGKEGKKLESKDPKDTGGMDEAADTPAPGPASRKPKAAKPQSAAPKSAASKPAAPKPAKSTSAKPVAAAAKKPKPAKSSGSKAKTS